MREAAFALGNARVLALTMLLGPAGLLAYVIARGVRGTDGPPIAGAA